ncbi:MAG: hypothetical protein Q4G30_00220 [Actinomycetaceae bacterium]|nr:hypothetical protein [Actinomycetaceae bacterium]
MRDPLTIVRSFYFPESVKEDKVRTVLDALGDTLVSWDFERAGYDKIPEVYWALDFYTTTDPNTIKTTLEKLLGCRIYDDDEIDVLLS